MMTTSEGDLPRFVVAEPAELRGTVLVLSRQQMVVGHSGSADLAVDDRFVSRRHALITVDDAGLATIQDLNSTGGTFVNDVRLSGPRALGSGDLVRFADLVATFEAAGSRSGREAGPQDAPTAAWPVIGGTTARDSSVESVESVEQEAAMITPSGNVPLAGSERPRPASHRLVGPVEAGEVIGVTLVVRPQPGSPALPELEYWQATPPGQRPSTGTYGTRTSCSSSCSSGSWRRLSCPRPTRRGGRSNSARSRSRCARS